MRVAAKINHVVNGHCNPGIDERHHKNAEEVEHCRHDDRGGRAHGARGNTGGNCVWRVRPAVHQDNAQRERYGHGEQGIAEHLGQEVA